MRSIVFMFLLSLLSSCASQQKQADGAYRFFRQHPAHLARLCADQFPVREHWIGGKEIIQTDTLHVAGEIVPCPPSNEDKTGFIRCPGSKTIIQKVLKTDTLVRENSARIAQLMGELQASQHQGALYHRLAKKLGWILLGVLLLGIGYLFIRCRSIAS
jgi:hypothetical protein